MSADFRSAAITILDELQACLSRVDEQQADELIESICGAKRIFIIGVGRVMLMAQAFVKRLNHIGIGAYFVGEINEPAITADDLLIVASGSGESVVPVAIARTAKQYGSKIAYIGANLGSTIASMSDIVLRLPCRTKLALADEMHSLQPMSSLFEQSLLLLFDGLSLAIIKREGIDISKLWEKHANLE